MNVEIKDYLTWKQHLLHAPGDGLLPAVSLFGRLQSLYRSDRFQLEDFHTEIVAQVLRDAPKLTLDWLRRIGATDLGRVDSCQVQTQMTFPALDGHDLDSRVDLVIRLRDGGRQELIFVESKVGSQAGDTQLPRYLDHLAHLRPGVDRATLVFVTRSFEADYAAEFAQPGRCPPGVAFRQTRWFELHRLLATFTKHNPLAAQLALFMQEHGMNLRHRFRTTDIVALENFFAVKTLMDETLDGQVRQSMNTKLRYVSTLNNAMRELASNNRYVLSVWRGPHHVFLAGYYLPEGGEPDEEVLVSMDLACGPGAPMRRESIDAFRQWASRGHGWTTEGLEDDQRWGWLRKSRTLPGFLAEPDHVEAIRSFLLQALDEVSEFQAAYPALPWRDESQTPPDPAAEPPGEPAA